MGDRPAASASPATLAGAPWSLGACDLLTAQPVACTALQGWGGGGGNGGGGRTISSPLTLGSLSFPICKTRERTTLVLPQDSSPMRCSPEAHSWFKTHGCLAVPLTDSRGRCMKDGKVLRFNNLCDFDQFNFLPNFSTLLSFPPAYQHEHPGEHRLLWKYVLSMVEGRREDLFCLRCWQREKYT